jgi:hypothetical protein
MYGDKVWTVADKDIPDPGFGNDVIYTYAGLESGMTYEFRVNAVNEDSASGYGNLLKVKTEGKYLSVVNYSK